MISAFRSRLYSPEFTKMRRHLPTLFFLALINLHTVAEARLLLTGTATIIDGDTLIIKGKRIRLYGIDAPESPQYCIKNRKSYRCGKQAGIALSKKIYQRTIQCEQRTIDRYKRIVAVCRLGSIDLNRWMVLQGWAVAYRKYSLAYLYEEKVAKNAKTGIWAGSFVKPHRWRRGERLTDKNMLAPKRSKCRIKGNISRRGKLN